MEYLLVVLPLVALVLFVIHLKEYLRLRYLASVADLVMPQASDLIRQLRSQNSDLERELVQEKGNSKRLHRQLLAMEMKLGIRSEQGRWMDFEKNRESAKQWE